MMPIISVATEREGRIDTYLNFERAYMNNDVREFEPWLAKSYEIRQTLHIPGVGSDTRPVTKEQLLSSMKAVGKPSTMPRSVPESVEIEDLETGFCATSSTVNETTVSGEAYEEKEVREVCFEPHKDSYKAYKHTIDVYFKKR
jgi:hypothetical protein